MPNWRKRGTNAKRGNWRQRVLTTVLSIVALLPSAAALRAGDKSEPRKDPYDERPADKWPKNASIGPVSPARSLEAFRVRPGFTVELVVSEPLVQDPVAFEWGADGKLWVVEMGDYPLGIDGQGTPGGRVKYLEDTDGDGHYDKATVFLDKLNMPNGVLPWGKGVLITAAPDIFMPSTPTATAGPTCTKSCTAVSARAIRSTASMAWCAASTTGSICANGDSGGNITLDQDPQAIGHRRPRFPHPSRDGRDRNRGRKHAVPPQPRRLGRLVRQQQYQPALAVRPRRTLPAAKSAGLRGSKRGTTCRSSRGVARLSGQPDRDRGSTISERGQSLHLGLQRDRLSATSFSVPSSLATASSASRCTISSIAR